MSLALSLDLEIDVNKLKSELTAACTSIVGQFEPVEKTFLEIGGALNQLCEDVSDLSGSARTTAEKTTAHLQIEVLPKVSHASKSLLDDLNLEQSKIKESLEAIQSISSSLGELHQSVKYLNAVARRVDNIRLYIGIESARSAATRESFASFTEEMQKLGEMVVQTCHSLTEDEERARTEQDQAYLEISNGLIDLINMATEGEGASKQAIESIDDLLTQTATSLVNVSTHSESIGKLIDRIVLALQFQDITRQQLEHVVDAIKDVDSMIQFCSDGQKEETSQIAHIIIIQQAHILEAVASVGRVRQEISDSFDEAKNEVQLLLDCLPRVCHQEAGLSDQASFGELLQKTDQLLSLQQHVKVLDLRASDTAKSASQATATLSSHVNDVRRISQDMELRALNAAVKSARLGEDGRTLKILSEEVTKLSAGSKNFVDTTVANLNAITEASTKLASTLHSSNDNEPDQIELHDLMQLVNEATQELRQTCEAITQNAGEVQLNISACRQSISFLDRFSESLTDSSNRLTDCIEMLRPWTGDIDLQSGDRFNLQSERYTMESERNIHRLFVSDDVEKGANDDSDVAKGGCILF
jgi:methyl-accepting chemotaxis protein